MYDRPFRWWVQSVMPLVFDDSLSYYEVLAKLTKYIQGLTGDVEQIEKILATIEGIDDITQFTEFLERIQAEIGNLENLQTDTKGNLVSAINEVALKADIAYWKPPTGIPESDLSQEVKDKLNKSGEATEYIINNNTLKKAPNNNSPADLGLGTYSVPTGGIPWETLSQDVRDRINAGGGGTGGTTDYTELNNKPQINGHTLNAGNNTLASLGLGTYNKPSAGIPESDLSAEVQEKLNTSGGIADNQESFVASRDYEAGELVYINGVLYKTKYKILAGTTMIPGNNIETTDISAELEKINSDIESLQSGAGLDSWTLATNVISKSTDVVRIFEYFNCIGGENYLFIITPITAMSNGSYRLQIRKRDGTIVHTELGDPSNQRRFTFTPNDTGEYYCEFTNLSDDVSNSNYRVEIEYTESQGISELWSKVNQAIELGEDVPAIQELVNQHTVQINELNGVSQRVEILKSDVAKNNSDNILNNVTVADFTTQGIAFTVIDKQTMHVEGTSTGLALKSIYSSTSMPEWLETGKPYYLEYSTESKNVLFRIYIYRNGNLVSPALVEATGNQVFTVPTDATGIIFRLAVKSGYTVNEDVTFAVLNAKSNSQLTDDVEELEQNTIKNDAPSSSVASGDDLNNSKYLTPGQWSIPTTPIAVSLVNRPADLNGTGTLTVVNTHNSNHVYQLIMSNQGTAAWVRHVMIDSLIFDDWCSIVDVKNTIKSSVPSDSVASGDNLNDSKYLTPGQWKISSTAIAVSLANRPMELLSTGTLTVVNTHNTNHVYQLILSNQGTAAWTRHVRVDTLVFDDWCSVINGTLYSWQSKDFLIHIPQEENRYMVNALKEIGITIANSMDWPKVTNGERNLSSDVAYALWDALQAKYPEYIDPGETIAYSLDTEGNNYKPVKAYYIHPKLSYGISTIIAYPDMPTIYITAGTHGSEPTPVWNLYALFSRAFESKTVYADFLTDKKYRVVPCLDRWSYDHAKRYLAAAYNADGTTKESAIDPNTGEISELYDANRQCICSDNNSPSYETLTMNSFATEAIGLVNYLRTCGYSAANNDCYIDLHNNSESLGYFGTWREDLRKEFNVMIDRLAKIWKQHATWANGDPVDYYNSSVSNHFALNGKICGRTIEQLTFAWFFYYAANQSKSMLLEVQAYDSGGNANSYALAKGLDMTYRWLKVLLE